MKQTQIKAVKNLKPVLENDPALQLRPVPGYSLKPLPEAFENIEEVLTPLIKDQEPGSSFDVTAFYSKRKTSITPDAVDMLLHHNQLAYTAAIKVSGFIIYFQGERLEDDLGMSVSPELGLDFNPDCLSFCIWKSRQHGKTGADVPEHRNAASQAMQWYDHFVIKKYELYANKPKAAQAQGFKKISFSEYEHHK